MNCKQPGKTQGAAWDDVVPEILGILQQEVFIVELF